MNEEIKVHVVDYGSDRNLVARYVDPLTGKQKSRSTGTRKRKEADKFAAKWEAELQEGRYKPASKITWEEFRERYETEVVASFADSTAETIASVFNTVEKLLNPDRLGKINAQRLSNYQRKLRESGRSECTVKKHIAHLMAALKWARDQGLINDVPSVKVPKRAKASKVMKGRPISGEEFERMLDKVSSVLFPKKRPKKHTPHLPDSETQRMVVESWKHYLQGLWWSGLRLQESLNLAWESRSDRITVDTSGEFVMLRIPAALEKGNQDRLYPVAPEFAEFLRELPAERRTGHVFNPMPVRDWATSRLSIRSVGRTISQIGKLAGVKVHEVNEKVKFASAHDLRRSFGERWAPRVMPQVLMELMRHERIETTMKFYVGHNAVATAKALYEAVGNTFGNTVPTTASDQRTENAESADGQQLSASTPYGI